MRTCLNILALASVFAGSFFVTCDGHAMSTKKRLAIIKALKLKGIVGENNQGLLEFRKKKKAEDLVEKENQKRMETYRSIADKQNVSVEKVGAQRAKQIAKDAPDGVWLQKPDGTWYKK